MPNRCFNTVSIVGSKKNIQRIENKIEQEFKTGDDFEFFQKLIPEPTSVEDSRYNWRCKNRGCKWDLSMGKPNIEYHGKRGSIDFTADSPRSPPLSGLQKISKKYEVDIEISFDEPGMCFSGIYNYENGECTGCSDFNDSYYGDGGICSKCGCEWDKESLTEIYNEEDTSYVCYDCLDNDPSIMKDKVGDDE